jgi:trigger factor
MARKEPQPVAASNAPALNVTVAEQDKLKRKLTVEVPLDEVSVTYERVYARLRSNIRVDGFRPGRFPRHLAEKRFKDAMAGEALQTLVPRYFEQALSELKLRPATEPHFDNLDIDKARPLKFEVEFEVVPEFKLLAPSAFRLKEEKAQVGPEEVDARIEELRGARASLEDKGEQPAAAGDVVTFDFQGTLDGEPFEGGAGENQQLEVGGGGYLPDFDAQFPGIRAGGEKTFDLTFPEDYGEGKLAGKTVRFQVTARQVQKKVPPPLDKDFFAAFGGHEELESFRQHVKAELEGEQARRALQAHRSQLTEQIREKYSFEVPESLVEHGLHEFEHELSHEEPAALQDEQALAKRKEEERGKIVGNLRVAYVIDALVREYEIVAEKEEVQQRFFLQAYMMRQNPTELINSELGRRLLEQIRQNLVTGKALEKLAGVVLDRQQSAKAGKSATGKDKPAATGKDKPAPKARAAASRGKPAAGKTPKP